MSDRELSTRKEDYLIDLKITPHSDAGPVVLERVRSKIYLPRKIADSISFAFHLDREQYQAFEQSKLRIFSIEGEHNIADLRTRFSADKVYVVNLSATHWSGEITDAVCVAEPLTLKKEHFRSRDESQPTPKTYTRFWLTPNRLITPAQSISRSYTGDVQITTVWKLEFVLENGLPLTFTNRYCYSDAGEDETVSWSELVAEYELEGTAQSFEEGYNVLDDLDDFLRLSSLAARHSCVCLGFDLSTTEGYLVDFYRRNVAIPNPKANRYDELIDIAHIEDFLDTTYRKFIALRRNDLIRQAINYTIPKEGRTVESSFITLYSALETLVLYFRKHANLELVFSTAEEDQWKQLQRALHQLFKRHPLLRNERVKRMRLYDNIQGLKRVSFRTALQECYNFYGIDVSDLWPVSSNKEGWSLSVIRNKLVHGEYFNSAQRHAIDAAKSHLQWTIERLLLSILGWDISNSHVNAGFLSRNRPDYRDWKSDRKILSN